MFGSGFLELGGSDLQGSSIEGDLNLADYDESVFGFSSVELLFKTTFLLRYTAKDSEFYRTRTSRFNAQEVDITQAELDRIIDIAINK